jgi:hypothetical protein
MHGCRPHGVLGATWLGSPILMPLYFFHVRDGKDLIHDHVGIELPDFGAALSEARAAMRELAIEALRHAQGVHRMEIEINDGSGRTLQVVTSRDVLDGDEP